MSNDKISDAQAEQLAKASKAISELPNNIGLWMIFLEARIKYIAFRREEGASLQTIADELKCDVEHVDRLDANICNGTAQTAAYHVLWEKSNPAQPAVGDPTPKTTLGGWHAELCDKGEYLQLRYSNRPGDIQLRAGDQGFTVAFVPESGNEPIAEQWAEYRQLNDVKDIADK